MSTQDTNSGRSTSVGFIEGCREELNKVSSPTRQEAIQATIVTLIMVAVVSSTLALFDVVFKQLMTVLLS